MGEVLCVSFVQGVVSSTLFLLARMDGETRFTWCPKATPIKVQISLGPRAIAY